jgi:hypothetical protein
MAKFGTQNTSALTKNEGIFFPGGRDTPRPYNEIIAGADVSPLHINLYCLFETVLLDNPCVRQNLVLIFRQLVKYSLSLALSADHEAA